MLKNDKENTKGIMKLKYILKISLLKKQYITN